jgi:hypothetical protein
MFPFRYALDCPLCQSTYGAGKAFVIAASPADAKKQIASNHPICPLCKESWSGITVEIGLFGGGVREAT